MYVLPYKHLRYTCYRLGYRVRHDIRCFLQRPNIVSRAINRNIAYVYYTRDRYRYGISTSVRELRAVGPLEERSAIADFPEFCARTEQTSGNRLSPSQLGANSPELLHTCSNVMQIPAARLIYMCYRLRYRASDDIRSLQKAPNIVASAISQFVAYIY